MSEASPATVSGVTRRTRVRRSARSSSSSSCPWRPNPAETLAPTTALAGGLLYYGQFACPIAAPGLTLLDDTRDWRNRVLVVDYVQQANAADLPKGANYDPDVAMATDNPLMYTQTGATAANPPVGFFRTLNAGRYLFAASSAGGPLAAGDLGFWNNPAGANVWIQIQIYQYPDAS